MVKKIRTVFFIARVSFRWVSKLCFVMIFRRPKKTFPIKNFMRRSERIPKGEQKKKRNRIFWTSITSTVKLKHHIESTPLAFRGMCRWLLRVGWFVRSEVNYSISGTMNLVPKISVINQCVPKPFFCHFNLSHVIGCELKLSKWRA